MIQLERDDLIAEARRLLSSLDVPNMSPSAYDTAWVARLPSPADPQLPRFPGAFDWLLQNQKPDGSWGAELAFAHDRVVCTLGALLTLATSSYRRQESEIAVRRAVVYLNREQLDLRQDPAETVGFELVLPELLRQAKSLRLSLPYDDWAFVERIKEDKLKRIPPIAVYGGPTTLITSLEYLGETVAIPLVGRCQSPNGSFGASPSATAYVGLHRVDDNAISFLEQLAVTNADGSFPFMWPFTMYDLAWSLRELRPFVADYDEYRGAVAQLASFWTVEGMQDARVGQLPDLDTTAVAAIVLQASGMNTDLHVFELFEADEYFYCYALERNQSVTTNAHAVEALRACAPSPEQRRMLLKAVHFLKRTCLERGYWEDKWHASPYYATTEVIRALTGLAVDFVRRAVDWLLKTQYENGAWGIKEATAEETALAISGLIAAADGDVSLRPILRDAICKGAAYLSEHLDDAPVSLWIGKGLYAPHNMVHAIKLGALARAEAYRDELGAYPMRGADSATRSG